MLSALPFIISILDSAYDPSYFLFRHSSLSLVFSLIPYGLVVRIPAFHAGGPGSIPGVGGHFVKTPDINHMDSCTDISGSAPNIFKTPYQIKQAS